MGQLEQKTQSNLAQPLGFWVESTVICFVGCVNKMCENIVYLLDSEDVTWDAKHSLVSTSRKQQCVWATDAKQKRTLI